VKEPNRVGWQSTRLNTPEDVDAAFPEGAASNVGLLLDDLADVDLDSAEARRLAKLRFLPATPWVSGRPGSPESHWFYRCPNAKACKFLDPTKDKTKGRGEAADERVCLLELRTGRQQTLVEPSIHPSGEPVRWKALPQHPPPEETASELTTRVSVLAAASLLLRYYPGRGGRHDFVRHLAGGLAHGNWDPDRAKFLIGGVVRAAEDSEEADRMRVVADTFTKHQAGEQVTGWPTLAEGLGENGKAVVRCVRKWLGITGREAKGKKGKDSAASAMVAMAQDAGACLFHTADETPYAVVARDGHKETWALRSTSFRRWLAKLHYDKNQKAPSSQAIVDALAVLEGLALHDGPELPVFIRVAEQEGFIYIDLANDKWEAVAVSAAGWQVTADYPVRFRRPKGSLPLPYPQRGGSLADLRPFVNTRSAGDFLLVVAWLAAALRPRGPFPLLALLGQQGSAKSSLGRILKKLPDPAKPLLRAEPRDGRDLMIAANNGWVVAFDNLSYLPQDLSDYLCRLATGGGFTTRQLYTDDEEILFESTRPVLITSITDVITAPDLLDRTIPIDLAPIGEESRKTEEELDREFEAAWPKIFAALLDAVAGGLKALPNVKLSRLPRMADFAVWAEAVGVGLGWKRNAFIDAYAGNRDDANAAALEASPVVPPLFRFIDGCDSQTWMGAATDLHDALNATATDAEKKIKGWPAKPHNLSGALRRLAPNLLRAGLRVCFDKVGHDRRRVVILERAGGGSPSAADGDSPNPSQENNLSPDGGPPSAPGDDLPAEDVSGDAPLTDDPPADAVADAADAVRTLPGDFQRPHLTCLPEEICDGNTPHADAADAVTHTLSGATSRSGPGWLLAVHPEHLPLVLASLDEVDRVGLDVETTGLHWRTDRVRLLSLGCLTSDGSPFAHVLDLFALPPASLAPVWEALQGKEIVGHNLEFDLPFLTRLGFTPGDRTIYDTMILSRLLTAGTTDSNSLDDVAKRHLGVVLDKTHQRDDWSAPTLSDEQLGYAAADVLHLDALLAKLLAAVGEADLTQTWEIERRCLPGWLWMMTAGMPIDVEAWGPLATKSRADVDRLHQELHDAAPQRPGDLPGVGSTWNFNSQPQVKQLLDVLGFKVKDTTSETLAAIDHPFADLVRKYRQVKWLDGAYGAKFLRFVDADGRVYGRWVQTGNEAGRSSCRQPNLQQIPRQVEYRKAFRAPPGKVLVKADFAAAHLRIVCRVADEQKMLAAFKEGRDLHRMTAASLLGKPEADVTKQDRQLAKAVAFGLLYGMQPPGLRSYAMESYGVEMTLAEAGKHRATFFQTYPGLAAWHRKTDREKGRQRESRSLAGRRRVLDPKTPIMHRLNSPVLGTEADAAKTALALLWERRADCPDARPVAFVHDEIVIETYESQAPSAALWVQAAMTEALAGLINPVPVEVETKVAPTWGG
jgi:DNA polymerase I-like protein with 3'-5' exonuclease and polymerase domains